MKYQVVLNYFHYFTKICLVFFSCFCCLLINYLHDPWNLNTFGKPSILSSRRCGWMAVGVSLDTIIYLHGNESAYITIPQIQISSMQMIHRINQLHSDRILSFTIKCRNVPNNDLHLVPNQHQYASQCAIRGIQPGITFNRKCTLNLRSVFAKHIYTFRCHFALCVRFSMTTILLHVLTSKY